MRSRLLRHVIQHSRIAFESGWMRFDEAKVGELLIVPPDGMRQAVARDYAAMQAMTLFDAPPFEEVLGAIVAIDRAYRAVFRRANATAEDRR